MDEQQQLLFLNMQTLARIAEAATPLKRKRGRPKKVMDSEVYYYEPIPQPQQFQQQLQRQIAQLEQQQKIEFQRESGDRQQMVERLNPLLHRFHKEEPWPAKSRGRPTKTKRASQPKWNLGGGDTEPGILLREWRSRKDLHPTKRFFGNNKEEIPTREVGDRIELNEDGSDKEEWYDDDDEWIHHDSDRDEWNTRYHSLHNEALDKRRDSRMPQPQLQWQEDTLFSPKTHRQASREMFFENYFDYSEADDEEEDEEEEEQKQGESEEEAFCVSGDSAFTRNSLSPLSRTRGYTGSRRIANSRIKESVSSEAKNMHRTGRKRESAQAAIGAISGVDSVGNRGESFFSVRRVPCYYARCTHSYRRPNSAIVEFSDRPLVLPEKFRGAAVRSCKKHHDWWKAMKEIPGSCEICRGLNYEEQPTPDIREYKNAKNFSFNLCRVCAQKQALALGLVGLKPLNTTSRNDEAKTQIIGPVDTTQRSSSNHQLQNGTIGTLFSTYSASDNPKMSPLTQLNSSIDRGTYVPSVQNEMVFHNGNQGAKSEHFLTQKMQHQSFSQKQPQILSSIFENETNLRESSSYSQEAVKSQYNTVTHQNFPTLQMGMNPSHKTTPIDMTGRFSIPKEMEMVAEVFKDEKEHEASPDSVLLLKRIEAELEREELLRIQREKDQRRYQLSPYLNNPLESLSTYQKTQQEDQSHSSSQMPQAQIELQAKEIFRSNGANFENQISERSQQQNQLQEGDNPSKHINAAMNYYQDSQPHQQNNEQLEQQSLGYGNKEHLTFNDQRQMGKIY